MTDLQNITSGPLFFELFTFVAFLAINVFVFDRVSLSIYKCILYLTKFYLLSLAGDF